MNDFSSTITFLQTDDLKKTSDFYINILKCKLIVDQGQCHIYETSKGGYIGFCSHEFLDKDKNSVCLTFVCDSKEEVDKWCDEILDKSPGAIAGLKACFNAATTYMRGIEEVSARYLWRYYATDEAEHWKKSFWEKRKPEWQRFRRKEIFPGIYEGE